jgi:DNA polymerase-1
MARLMLIDGNSLTYRAFFALPTDLATASGQVTNAVFGFTSMLINLVRDHEPTAIAVAFDRPEPTFRHEKVDTYKAGRAEAPDILRQQMGLVRQVVDVLKLPVLEVVGVEADDIIATLATRARDQGTDVLIVTGDRDVYQLVEDPHVKVLYNKRGVSDYALYDEAGILERTGVKPSDYVQYAALRGDTSDNLPGVPGVGEKTAAKLVNKYGDLDGIFSHVDEQTPKLRENLAANEAQARLNVEMMVLLRDVPECADVELDQLKVGDFDTEEVRKLFDFLEFRTLYDRFDEAFGSGLAADGGAGGEVLEAEVTEVGAPTEAVALLARLAEATGEARTPLAVAPAWVGREGHSALEGLALVTDGAGAEVAWLPTKVLDDPTVGQALQALTDEGGRPLAAHGAKPLLLGLRERGTDVRTLQIDTMLASYLLDPAEARYLLEDLLPRYANLVMPEPSAASEGQLDLDGSATDTSVDAARRALAVDRLVEPLSLALEAQGLSSLNDDIEVPLVRVLAKMEELGVGIDRKVLEDLSQGLVAETEQLAKEIQEAAGRDFNVNSTPQLREVLFDELGLTPQKKTKTGFSTDAASLEKMVDQHPIVELLLRYREVEKLRSTYGEGLLAEVAPDGRIHATFNQYVARTGRLSSDQPNLHNIPVRSERGRAFRRAFVPDEGHVLLVADYNQIELRCIAHLAQDPGLIDAFESGRDIHTETASRIFGVEADAVTGEQRSKAKMVSYGLAYGMEAYGLGQRLGIPTDEAAVILNAYFEAFPSVKQYMDDTVAEARERGYTETLFGRRRQIPELASNNTRIRQAGERQAMNAGIQGLAADIFKVALVRLDAALDAREERTRLILQVHDEVLLEVLPAEQDEVAALTVETLSGAAQLDVPLEVNLSFGASWADAKG